MPGPQGFPNIAPYDTRALIAMLTSLARNKSAEEMQSRRLMFQGIGDLGGAFAQQQHRKDVKTEKASDRIHATQQQRRRQEGYDRRAKAASKAGAAADADRAAAAKAKALQQALANSAKAKDRALKDGLGENNESRFWDGEAKRLMSGGEVQGGEAEQQTNFDSSALDRPAGDAAASAPAPADPRVGQMHTAQDSAIRGQIGPPPVQSPEQQHGAAVAQGMAEFYRQQQEQAQAAAQPSPAQPAAPAAPTPGRIARLPRRSQTFLKPLSSTAQSFQIKRVFREDPNARKAGSDARPTTEVGAVWKAAMEMVTEHGMTPEQATERVMELLGDEAWVKKNLPGIAYTIVERDGKTFHKPKHAVVSSTPFYLVNEGPKGPRSAPLEKARRVLNDLGVGVPLPPGTTHAPHVLNRETGETYPLTPTSAAGPSLKDLESRIGGSLFRRGGKDPATWGGIAAKRTFGGSPRAMFSTSGPLTLRAEGHHLVKHDPRFARETILELLNRAAAGRR